MIGWKKSVKLNGYVVYVLLGASQHDMHIICLHMYMKKGYEKNLQVVTQPLFQVIRSKSNAFNKRAIRIIVGGTAHFLSAVPNRTVHNSGVDGYHCIVHNIIDRYYIKDGGTQVCMGIGIAYYQLMDERDGDDSTNVTWW